MKTSDKTIAIIGMAGIFPEAENLRRYWENILEEVDCIRDVPATHWSIDEYYDPDPKAPDKTYCRRGGFLPPVEFDPLEFGLPPNILEVTDVAQLLSLVVAKRALRDAGYGELNPYAHSTGVILGAAALNLTTALTSRLQYPVWERVLANAGIEPERREAIVDAIRAAYVRWQEDAFPGYLSNVVAGRVANRLNLGGINCTIDAACASSLASLQMAVDELLLGRTDMMIAGGVDLNNTISAFVSFSKTPAFTAHECMRPFDAGSDGMLIGEGIGMVVLQRLDDALRDGNRVYAVIKGIGSSSDGKNLSIYAPSRDGQVLALRRAYENAGCSPDSIGLVEAHGTGTRAGDPAETTALGKVFAEYGMPQRSVALGSVKSQIGHTKVAAGIAGVIKAVYALSERILPPTINITEPNPKLDLERTPFYLNTKTRPWFSRGPRRAAVSAFGFGGTNFHIVLEEHDGRPSDRPRARGTPHMIVLHAPSVERLVERCLTACTALDSEKGSRAFPDLVTESAAPEIPESSPRLGFVASNSKSTRDLLEAAIDALASNPDAEAFDLPSGVHYRRRSFDIQGGVVALFPGQGSQYLEMGLSLCMNFPEIKRSFELMDEARAEDGCDPVSSFVYPPPVFSEAERKTQSVELQRTDRAQAAIGAFSLGLYEILHRAGFSADFTAGHSLGELTALRAAGAVSETEFYALLRERGKAMLVEPSANIDPGAMAAIIGPVEVVEDVVSSYPDVRIANRNSRSQLVAAGASESIERLGVELTGRGCAVSPLPVSGAFHTSFVERARAPFAECLSSIPFSSPTVPVYSNTTAERYPSEPDSIRALLATHMVEPVDFVREIENIHRAGGTVFVEFGSTNVLTKFVDDILDGKFYLAIPLLPKKNADSDLQFRDAVVRLRVAGVKLGTVDPAAVPPETKPLSRPGVVTVCGAPYVSESTKAAFERIVSQLPRIEENVQSPGSTTRNTRMENEMPETSSPSSLRDLSGEENLAYDLHLRYLDHMRESEQRLFELAQKQYSLLSSAISSPAMLESFERTIALFREQQTSLERMHESFLNGTSSLPPRSEAVPRLTASIGILPNRPSGNETAPQRSQGGPAPSIRTDRHAPEAPDFSSPFPALSSLAESDGAAANGVAAPVDVPARRDDSRPPVSAPTAERSPRIETETGRESATDKEEDFSKALLAVVSETTGYPLDMIDLTMDLESDLGIDSIKRVQILAALEGRIGGDISEMNFERFAELRTLGHIVEFIESVKKNR